MTTARSLRAALAPRAGAAEAVHEAICELTSSDGADHGGLYALACSRVASVLTLAATHPLGVRWAVCAGSLQVDGQLLRGRHGWIARVAGSNEPGPPLGRAAGELVDFSVRHWPTWAALAGVSLERELPSYFWDGSAAPDRASRDPGRQTIPRRSGRR